MIHTNRTTWKVHKMSSYATSAERVLISMTHDWIFEDIQTNSAMKSPAHRGFKTFDWIAEFVTVSHCRQPGYCLQWRNSFIHSSFRLAHADRTRSSCRYLIISSLYKQEHLSLNFVFSSYFSTAICMISNTVMRHIAQFAYQTSHD